MDALKNYARIDDKVLAIWSPSLPRTAPHTVRALDLLDESRVSSVVGIYRAFLSRQEAVMKDKELSALGQTARMREIAAATLSSLATPAKQVVEMEAAHQATVNSAVVIPKADASDTLIDLALAAQAKGEGKVPTLMESSSERMRQALVRVPVELSGITETTRERLRGSLVSPEKAREFGEASEAISAARTAVQKVINLVAPQVDALPREKAAMVGPGWKIPGLVEIPTMEGVA